ncbi:MAG TPA: hypothetical protein ENK86_00470 [Campylobacterales bacterium]|nr:hypothetical protein [Campylobacterales bacterium]
MTTQTVRLDISNDIFDKVMFFLENLPKNKIKLELEKREPDSLFGDFLNHSQSVDVIQKFDREALHER